MEAVCVIAGTMPICITLLEDSESHRLKESLGQKAIAKRTTEKVGLPGER